MGSGHRTWPTSRKVTPTSGRRGSRVKVMRADDQPEREEGEEFFRGAVRKKYIAENPMADLHAAQQVNRGREHFVTKEVTAKVIDPCRMLSGSRSWPWLGTGGCELRPRPSP